MKKKTGRAVRLLTCLMMTAIIFFTGIPFASFTGDTVFASDGSVAINETNFPDAVFRSVIASADYDRDGNGYLDANEIALTINIYCEGMGITSIKGVEYFTALQGLWCKDNAISSMDLSNNKDLHGVWCSGNLFTSLDFSANPELEWVYCYDCNLTSLNVSNNPKMAFIECNTNPLTSLDVSNNPLLEHLTCGTCNLTSLDLSNNPELSHLDAFSNQLKSLDVSHNTKLKRLDIWNNRGLGSIDVSNNPGLQYYNCAYNGATSVDVSNNPELLKLICSYNDITSLDLSKNPKLVYLDCACNDLTSLNLSGNPQLYFLQAFTNPFTSLNISDNPFLVQTYNEGTKKSEAAVCQGHSWTLDYGGDTSTGGDNIYFLCFDDKVSLTTGSPSASSTAATLTPNTTLDPNLVTRETAIWTLYNMAGCPDVSGLTSRFTDVESGAWYEAALLWGEANSIAVGCPYVSSDTFGVGQYVSRQDLCLMLMRYSEYKNYKRAIDFGRSDEYLDYYDIDYYAWEAVCWAATWHIMEGKGEPGAPKSEQKIEPHANATRAEFEEMINNMLAVNGISGMTSFPIPDTTATGTTSTAAPAGDTDTVSENEAVSDNEAEEESVSSNDTEVSASEDSVSGDTLSSASESLNDITLDEGLPPATKSLFWIIIILGGAGMIGYRIYLGKKNKKDN